MTFSPSSLQTLSFSTYIQSVSREVLSSVQWSQGQPAGCLSVARNYEDTTGGALPANQGCVCGGRLTERDKWALAWLSWDEDKIAVNEFCESKGGAGAWVREDSPAVLSLRWITASPA